MSCTPCCGNAGCPCKYAPWLPRIAFGLVLVAYGVNHYVHLSDFVGMAKSVYPSVPVLGQIAGVLAYIVPLLMIVGGALFAVKQLCCISKMCVLASLSGIMGWAALAVLVGDGQIGGQAMPMIQSAGILLILYMMIKKMGSCGAKACCPSTAGGATGQGCCK